ncbi:MAG: cyclase family protein [Deltaproteobacteria bacterium]|nr:MAG: cyclase family protein [Deltaproteobacteria bacterium]
MLLHVRALGQTFQARTDESFDIAIAQRFDAEQPNAFGLPDADATFVRGDDFVLSVHDGAPINCSTLTLTPHANGTHTESIAHITTDGPSVLDVLDQSLLLARLVTTDFVRREDVPDESYLGTSQPHDRVIAAQSLDRLLPGVDSGTPTDERPRAIVVRTLPNTTQKPTRRWATTNPPYFTEDAIRLLLRRGYQHLLVDLPSIDREQDDGAMAAHRTWWELPPVGTSAGENASRRTITEFCYVPDTIPDGLYLLELQIAPLALDAVPSRPRLIPLRRIARPH